MAYMKIIIKSLDSNRNFVALPLASLGVRQVQQSAIPIAMHAHPMRAIQIAPIRCAIQIAPI